MAMKKILVACSSEISPSTTVAKKVGSLCKQKGISCATVQCTAQEAKSKVKTLRPDVIIGAMDFMEEFDVPVLSGDPFLDDVESEKTMDQLMFVLGS